MTAFETAVWAAYLLAVVAFVVGLHLMNSPVTAARGNGLSAGGMTLAVVATVALLADRHTITTTGLAVLIAGAVVGGGAGLYLARRAAMTAMPQLVSVFNAVGGGAAALLAVHEFAARGAVLSTTVATFGVLDILVGGVTFAGSLVAAGKLQGVVPSQPLMFPGRRSSVLAAVLTGAAAGVYLIVEPGTSGALLLLPIAAVGLGTALVLPIGGADMPVVVSLLNAFTGVAVAMAGFVLDSLPLITAGALVGASGTILTRLMATAMNRSIIAIAAGGFGTGDGGAAVSTEGATIRRLSAEDVAIQLAYATKVVVVPGYGLAAAQAQHEVADLATELESRGVEVSFAIHPVAGRMPGHMNVLLAEAHVPYLQMLDLEQANAEFPRADVALVIGANDVTNPAARRPGNAVSGMPILDVDQARSVVVIKRSLGHGYAGIDNELYTDARTGMFFADAKRGLADIRASVKMLIG
jgi:proton-translocating NAD(P)+ transhydrogenase subunit beta